MRGNFCYHEIEKCGAVWSNITRVMDINLTETEAGRHIEHHNLHGVTLADLMVLLILSISYIYISRPAWLLSKTFVGCGGCHHPLSITGIQIVAVWLVCSVSRIYAISTISTQYLHSIYTVSRPVPAKHIPRRPQWT